MVEQTHRNVLYVKCNKKEDAKFLFLFRYSQSPLGTQPLSSSLPSWESQRGNRNIESGRRGEKKEGGRICGIGKGGEWCRG